MYSATLSTSRATPQWWSSLSLDWIKQTTKKWMQRTLWTTDLGPSSPVNPICHWFLSTLTMIASSSSSENFTLSSVNLSSTSDVLTNWRAVFLRFGVSGLVGSNALESDRILAPTCSVSCAVLLFCRFCDGLSSETGISVSPESHQSLGFKSDVRLIRHLRRLHLIEITWLVACLLVALLLLWSLMQHTTYIYVSSSSTQATVQVLMSRSY